VRIGAADLEIRALSRRGRYHAPRMRLARLGLAIVLGSGLGACLFSVVSSASASSAAEPRRPGSPKPALLITIVVDQLAAWEAAERWPALPAAGGFARLRREGLWVRELRYAHAVTDTAPGHAALFTGAAPRDSGIFANETVGADLKPRSILLDPATRIVNGRGATVDFAGSSLARLRAPTLADALVAETPAARVFAFSLKDRGALFAAGRRPTAVAWIDPATFELMTSTAFLRLPSWAAPVAAREVAARARAGAWTLPPSDRVWVAAHAETPDDEPGEGDLAGLGRVFPHAVATGKAARATPFGDRFLFALGRAALANLGESQAPTLLALSLSSHDYVGHVFGPHSWEAWDELLELDRGLAALLDAADHAVGKDGYAVMLTGDHGSGALPEIAPEKRGVRCGAGAPADRWERPCIPSRRISPAAIAKTLEPALVATLGPGPWVGGFADPLAYLTPRAHALDDAGKTKLLAAAKRALSALGVDDVVDTHAGPRTCPTDETRATLVCRSIDPSGPGDLYLVVAPGAFFDPDVVPGSGMSHGSPYLYDRAVPLLVRAPGRVPAGAVREAPISFTAFARTAASLLGVRPPAAARDGEDLAARH
jgi:hypothetical protein